MFCSSQEKVDVWSIDLIRNFGRVQRRATKYILDLPFICDQAYGDRLINLNLLPVSYWHEFLDMIFFFKVVTGTVRVSPSVLPQVLHVRYFKEMYCNFSEILFLIEPPESGTR